MGGAFLTSGITGQPVPGLAPDEDVEDLDLLDRLVKQHGQDPSAMSLEQKRAVANPPSLDGPLGYPSTPPASKPAPGPAGGPMGMVQQLSMGAAKDTGAVPPQAPHPAIQRMLAAKLGSVTPPQASLLGPMAPESETATVTGAPSGPSVADPEFAAAQRRAGIQSGLAALGKNFSDAATLTSGHDVSNSPADAILKSPNAAIQALLARRQAGEGMEAKQREDAHRKLLPSILAQLPAFKGVDPKMLSGMDESDVGRFEKAHADELASAKDARDTKHQASVDAETKREHDLQHADRQAAIQAKLDAAEGKSAKPNAVEQKRLEAVDRAKQATKAYRDAVASGADDQSLRALHDDLVLAMKETMSRSPGRGPAMSAMLNMIPDSGRLTGKFKSVTGLQDPKEALDLLDKSLDRELPGTGGASAAGAGSVRVTDTKTRKTKTLSADRARHFLTSDPERFKAG